MKWLWMLLGAVGVGVLALSGSRRVDALEGDDVPPDDPWARPTNMLALAADPDREGLATGTVDSDAVLLETFPTSVAVSGYAFTQDPQLHLQAYLAMTAAARAHPTVVFLLYQDLKLTSHGYDEVAVTGGRFGKRTLPDTILPAEDIESLRVALEDAARALEGG